MKKSYTTYLSYPTLMLLLLGLLAVSCSGSGEEPAGIRLTSSANSIPPRLIAHRGYWSKGGASQNSASSLRSAFEEPRYLGAEIDIRKTSDGVLVLAHDNDINGVSIEDNAFSAIDRERLSNGEQAPTLEQALDILSSYPGKILALDIKTSDSESIIEAVRDYAHIDRLVFMSFSAKVCRELREAGFEPVYLLAWDIAELDIDDCLNRSLTGISIYAKSLFDNPLLLSEFINRGLNVYAWEATKAADVEKLFNMGVDRVITDLHPVNRR